MALGTSFRDRNPFVIGAVCVAIIFVMVAGAFAAGYLHIFEKNFPISAQFSDAAGLRAAAEVRMAGVKIGRVSSVTADRRNGRVNVRMVINDGVELGPETRADAALATLLGKRYVRLSGPVVRPYLASGAVIPVGRTTTPFDVFELTKVATRSIEATDTEKLNRLIEQLATITEGKHDTVKELVDGIARVSTAVAERDSQLRQLLDRSDAASRTLAEKDQTLVQLLDESDDVLQLLARRRSDVTASLRHAANAFNRLAGVVSTHKSELDLILDTLHPALDIVDKRQADLDRALTWLGPGAYGLALAPSHGPWADVYVRAIGPDLLGLLGGLAAENP
ncbi:MAG TPA: MlaD family protein [Acidimicrobiales bacterium]|nr:MlaD family protein [Acidimicrobiales bacterium]